MTLKNIGIATAHITLAAESEGLGSCILGWFDEKAVSYTHLNVILNIFPSLDTGVCAASVRKFNELAAGLPDTGVLAVSKEDVYKRQL